MFSSIVTGISAGAIALGALLGLLRGTNRSILRLVLIIACAVGAFFLMEKVADVILTIKVEGGVTLHESILAGLVEGGELPESVQTLIIALIEIVVGLAFFLLGFIVLSFLSWLIVFPILKIFVKPGVKKRRLLGMIIGAIQGVVVAFVLCVPVTGITNEVQKLSEIEVDGKKIIPVELNLEEFTDSEIYKIYNTSGDWFYETLTSKQTEDGTNVSLSDTVDVVVVVTDVVNETTNLATNLNKVSDSEANVQDKVDSLKNVGDNLINIGTKIDSLSDNAKEVLQQVITDVVGSFVGGGDENGEQEEIIPPAVQEVIENIDFDNLSLESTGEAIKGISSYIEKTDESFENYGQEVTQEEVESIVNGVADNLFIIDIITGGAEEIEEVPTIIEVKEEDAEKFETAISQADKLTNEQKEMLKKLLGII